MKNPIKTLILACALALAACSGPGPDNVEPIQQAFDATLTNNYGVITVAGMAACGGGSCPALIYWRNDNTCQLTWIGVATGGAGGALTGNVTLNAGTMGGAGWGNIAVLGQGQTSYLQCNNLTPTVWTLTGLAQNGYAVTVNGTSAGDYINCSGTGVIWCNGLDGNDIIESYGNRQVTQHGGNGNDKLRIVSVPTGSWSPGQYGDYGDDCLYTPTYPSTTDCGPGNDASNVNGTSCENVSGTTCP